MTIMYVYEKVVPPIIKELSMITVVINQFINKLLIDSYQLCWMFEILDSFFTESFFNFFKLYVDEFIIHFENDIFYENTALQRAHIVCLEFF